MGHSRFDRVPNHYAGPAVQRIKEFRRHAGRKSFRPTLLEVGRLQMVIPRHFGFCFGVERAIHMAFCALEEAPARPTYLVSEIIHNPLVNEELVRRGIRFLFDGQGRRQIPESGVHPADAVLIPAFGTTLAIEESLGRSGIDTRTAEFRVRYDTTCPFVAKVWKRGAELGRAGYTVVIHGKHNHEETRATQSRIQQFGPTLVVLDGVEAEMVAAHIRGQIDDQALAARFAARWSAGFDPARDLARVAVVNQTTMLAEETRAVSQILRGAMLDRYGLDQLDHRWADTSDTLCYATNQNQTATRAVLTAGAELAVIVGGYNSSNTAHLVEICSAAMPSYLVAHREEMLSPAAIRHFDVARRQRVISRDWLPASAPLRLVVTSGASCPDTLMDQVIARLVELCGYGPQELDSGLRGLRLLENSGVTACC